MTLTLRFASLVLFSAFFSLAHAQATGLLYDPQPPADSAYIRIIHAAGGKNVEVKIDNRTRLSGLKNGAASDYLVLPAGHHIISLHQAGQAKALVTTPLEVISGRSQSIAMTSLKDDGKPIIFMDKANSNKMKALISAYHLAPEVGNLDVLTADGQGKVFSNLAPGASAKLSVNPVSVSLIVSQSGATQAIGQANLSMDYGGTYSVLILPGEKGKLSVQAIQNNVERYAGK